MDIYNIAGEMFVYLNTCPQNYVKFYKYLFDERSVTDIILTIQNAIKNFHKERFRRQNTTSCITFKIESHGSCIFSLKSLNTI